MNVMKRMLRIPSDKIEKKMVIQVLSGLKLLTVEQVPPQLFVELAKEGLVKEPAESMVNFTDRVIEAYKKKA